MATEDEGPLPAAFGPHVNSHVVRTQADREGQRWATFTETELAGVISSGGDTPRIREAAATEMQRRVIESSKQLLTAIQASGDYAATQTAEVIELTKALKRLTWVLVGFGFIQIALMVWDVIRRFAA
jgi:hypothetical protein